MCRGLELLRPGGRKIKKKKRYSLSLLSSLLAVVELL
jgi:hypothetical protein